MKAAEVVFVGKLSPSHRRSRRLLHKFQLFIVERSINRNKVDELVFTDAAEYSHRCPRRDDVQGRCCGLSVITDNEPYDKQVLNIVGVEQTQELAGFGRKLVHHNSSSSTPLCA